MSQWNQYRLIDILSNIDLSLVEEEVPEGDLENLELFPQEQEKKLRQKRRIAILSGLAAGSIALTGAVVLVCRKHDIFKRAA